MRHFADCVGDDFPYDNYDEALAGTTIYLATNGDDTSNKLNCFDYSWNLAEEREDFVQSIWDAVCEEYNIVCHGMTYDMSDPNEVVDDIINQLYAPYNIAGKMVPASEVIFHYNCEYYTEHAYYFVSDWVEYIIHEIIEKTIYTYGTRTWEIEYPKEED